MAMARHAFAVMVAAVLGTIAMVVAPEMTVVYSLSGQVSPRLVVGPFIVLALLLLAAGLLTRLLFPASAWLLGPSTVLLVLLWCLIAPFTGEDASEYRVRWYWLLAIAFAASVPGTVGACLGELISRWRRRPRREPSTTSR